MKNKVLPMGSKSRKRLSQEQKHNLLVYTFYVLMILLVSLLQNTPYLFPDFSGARAWLLIPLVVCISMFERDLKATAIGVFAGALWDVYSAWGDGFHTIMMFFISTTIFLLLDYLMRNNLVTSLLLGAVSIVVYCLLHWFIFVVCRRLGDAGHLLLTYYLPTMLYTFAFTPVFYIIVRTCLVSIRNRYPKPLRGRRP